MGPLASGPSFLRLRQSPASDYRQIGSTERLVLRLWPAPRRTVSLLWCLSGMLEVCRSFMDSMEQHPVSRSVESLVVPGDEGPIKTLEYEH